MISDTNRIWLGERWWLACLTGILLTMNNAGAQVFDPCNPRPLLNDDFTLPLPQGLDIVFRRVNLRKSSDPDVHEQRLKCKAGGTEFTVVGSFGGKEPTGWYYWIGKYEISERQWAAVMSPSSPVPNVDLPKRQVSKGQAQSFADELFTWLRKNHKDRLPTFAVLRLPIEAEWQFAARGGTEVTSEVFAQPYPYPAADLAEYEWFRGPSSADGQVQKIGTRKPNPLGLHDMIGNVREWLEENFTRNGITGGEAVVGGSYLTASDKMRAEKMQVYGSAEDIGFRLVIGSLSETEEKPIELVRNEPLRPEVLPEATPPPAATPGPPVPTSSPAENFPRPTTPTQKPSPPVSKLTPGVADLPPTPTRLDTPRSQVSTQSLAGPSRPPDTSPANSRSSVPAAGAYTNSIGMEFLPVQELRVRFCAALTQRREYQTFVDALRENQALQKRLGIEVPTAWEKPRVNGSLIPVGPNYPVVKVTWREANAFCVWLSAKEGLNYRLPTPNEWWRARGGGVYPWGDRPDAPQGALAEKLLPSMHWRNPATGLYDLGTNVQEWSNDVKGRLDGETEKRAVVLGNGWMTHIQDERSFLHSFLLPPNPEDAELIDGLRQSDIGFRCVLAP